MHDFDLQVEFLLKANERNHDFRTHLDPSLLHFGGGFEDRARLHLGDFRERQSQAGIRGWPSIGLNSCSSFTRCAISFDADADLLARARFWAA